MRVFPFQFIWRTMLALDDRINSDELNRAVFRARDEDDLENSIERIRTARRRGDATSMGDEVINGERKNDRIVPWMSLASFGWILFPDKRAGGRTDYVIPPSTRSLLVEAAGIKHRHRSFTAVTEYVEYISRAAGLPRDLR